MIIYKATNLINGKIYIGQTITKLKYRVTAHKRDSLKKHSHLYCAIRKYGLDNFTWEKIDEALSIDELNKKETYWILFYKSHLSEHGYNAMLGGNNKLVNEETRIKMSKPGSLNSFYGKHHSDKTKAAISKIHKGKKISESQIKMLAEINSKRMTEKWKDDKFREKMIKNQKGKIFTQEHKNNIKKNHHDVKGEQNPASILNESKVKEIIKMLNKNYSIGEISKFFKVSKGCIADIKHKRTWKNLNV